ncbi:MAG: hypothetical protein DMF99_31205, partial [Acidobacteria bacterium]
MLQCIDGGEKFFPREPLGGSANASHAVTPPFDTSQPLRARLSSAVLRVDASRSQYGALTDWIPCLGPTKSVPIGGQAARRVDMRLNDFLDSSTVL